MYRITNIAASREGAWHHNIDGFSPESHTHQFEPWIGNFQIKLYESHVISEEHFHRSRALLEELAKHRIISVEHVDSNKPVELPELIVEEPALVEKAPLNKFELEVPVEEEVLPVKEEVKEDDTKLFGFETNKGEVPKITHTTHKKKGR